MTKITHGTCPTCNGETRKRHCPSPTNDQCDWWSCPGCQIWFCSQGFTVPINKKAGGK